MGFETTVGSGTSLATQAAMAGVEVSAVKHAADSVKGKRKHRRKAHHRKKHYAYA